jgi:hypothetical protein
LTLQLICLEFEGLQGGIEWAEIGQQKAACKNRLAELGAAAGIFLGGAADPFKRVKI